MATPSLNNGMFLRETSYQAGSHVDSYHLMNLVGDAKPEDMGVLEFWAQKQKVNIPIYQFGSFNGKNVKYIDNVRGEWTWKTPVVNELTMVHSDIEPSNITKGIDGQTFKVAFNKRGFGHSEIITYDKMNGVECIVTNDAIEPVNDKYIYTLRLMNNDNSKYLDNDYLQSSTIWFSVGSAINEHSERFNDLSSTAGYREYYNYVSDAYANQHYSISTRADLMAKGGMTNDGRVKVTEIWKYTDEANPLDPSIANIDQMAALKGAAWMKASLANGRLERSFITAIEGKCLTKVGKDIENQLMWGKGGFATSDGADDIRMSVGLWKQLDNGFKYIYNKEGFNLEMFRSEIFNFFNGKVEFEEIDPSRELIVQTGMGGMRMITEAIKREAVSSGLVINATDIGAITRTGMDLKFGFAFTQYIIPFLANMKFVINTAFDPVQANNIENPMVDGYRLSSYSFIIFDVTDNTDDNIFLMKKKWDNELRWWYQNGKMDYMGRTSGFQSSGNWSGYRVYMEQAYPTLWVADPTKLLKFVLKNPITNGSF